MDGAATAPRADERLIFRAYSFTLNFASTIATVDWDLEIYSLGAPRALIFVVGNDMIPRCKATRTHLELEVTRKVTAFFSSTGTDCSDSMPVT